jgi:phosphoglycerate kinase
MSLNPVAKRLKEILGRDVVLAPEVVGDQATKLKKSLEPGQALLLENLRFHPGETANDPEFSRRLAEGIEIYVNDAFGSCHRAHASVVGITQHVRDRAAGYLLEKEVSFLSKAIRSPERPLVAILGGAKVSDKIPVIENLLNKADEILIGGAMAYTFFKAQGFGVGRSICEEEKKETALCLLAKAKVKRVNFRLPLDHVLAPSVEAGPGFFETSSFPFPEDQMAVDIGSKTIEEYSRTISRAKTIIWNGPMGVFENDCFARGTLKIAEAVAGSSALSIVGGGDSVAAVNKSGVSHKISHVSTGGGATLEFLAYETLPGIEALKGD